MNHDCQEPNDSNNHNHDNDNEEELMDDIQRIRSLEREGDRYEQDGFLVEALSVYQRLLELHRATGQSANRIGKVHYRTGMIQYKRHCYNEALCHFDQALFIYQVNYNPDEINDNDDNDDDDVALDFYRVYVATGHVHLSNHNPYRAIDYFRRALQYVQPEPNTQASQPPPSMLSEQRFQQRHDTSYRMPYYAQVLHALGTAYETIGDEKEAQFHYHKAVTVKVHAAAATATTTTEVADQGN
jgi:tetratricopeptide (TPR) repeat protein